MTNLTTLLEEKNIKKAIVIDDMFNDVSPENLNQEDWSEFFDDLSEETEELIVRNYPSYRDDTSDQLKSSHEFVSALWSMSTGNDSILKLFSNYITKRDAELQMLNSLVEKLQSLGMDCEKFGSHSEHDTTDADLVIVDLFLDFRQSHHGIGLSIDFIRSLIRNRTDSPPLVVLMSRSESLENKRDYFRDEAGLLASTYRVVRKNDLEDERRLEVILTRLVTRYDDSKRIAAFVDSWKDGLKQAGEAFLKDLRRLDLTDFGQIQALLLEFEGQKLGEYILDVVDRVLQHEVEGNKKIIDATLDLNKITSGKYLAPHLEGTPDLQDFVYRMMFLHRERLKVLQDGDVIQLRFGDILRWRDNGAGAFNNKVSLVITPTCDLMRDGVKDVMLLFGELKNFDSRSWSYKPRPVRTAIVKPNSEDRNWIEWNLKSVKTVKICDLITLNNEGGVDRFDRLRETYALEIQQKFLADFGRVGQPANPPISFLVSISLFYVNTNQNACRLVDRDIDSAYYAGRGESPDSVHRLVLKDRDCDAIEVALNNLDINQVGESARDNLIAARTNRELLGRFERGEIEVSSKFVEDNGIIYAVVGKGTEYIEGNRVNGRKDRKAALLINVNYHNEG